MRTHLAPSLTGLLALFLLAPAAVAPLVAADLKADYGFAPKVVTRKDLRLGPGEVYVIELSKERYWVGSGWKYDEMLLKQALEGMINRSEPMVWLDDDEFLAQAQDFPKEWMRFYGESRKLKFLPKEEDLGKALTRVAPVFNGLIVYDPDQSDNIILALNLANLNFCLPVSERIFREHAASFTGIKVVAHLKKGERTRKEAYDWMIDNVLPRCDRTLGFSAGAPFPDLCEYTTSSAEGIRVIDEYRAGNGVGIDYAFYKKCFIFNVSASSYPRDCYGRYRAGAEDQATAFARIQEALVTPAPIFGWTLDDEVVYVHRLSDFGNYIDCSGASANLSFHARIPPMNPPPFIQDDRPRIDKPASKCYIAFSANEGDAAKTRVRMYHNAWLSPQRGKAPMNWDINPEQAMRFPSMVEYFFLTRTPNDYFICAPNGTGYTSPACMKNLDEYLKRTAAALTFINLRELEFWYADRPTLEKYAAALPMMRAFTITPMDAKPDWGLYETETNRVPVFRYARNPPSFYWFIQAPFKTAEPVWASRDTHTVDVNAVVKALNDYHDRTPKPCFAPFYGLETNVPEIIVKIQAKLDPTKFEIVDYATMAHLAKQAPRQAFPKMQTRPAKARWAPDMLTTQRMWTLGMNDAETSASADGLRVAVAKGKTWAVAAIDDFLVPAGAKFVRLDVGEVSPGTKWIFKLTGDLDGYGAVESWFFGDSAKPGEVVQPLDIRIHNRPDAPLRLELGAIGPEGGHVVFRNLGFPATKGE
ncbi:MAG: GxGYxYP family putative glycoside hydrolase [Candidatus Sumerlaeota bacterium]|nr:GxGYxYP family putative glycoside hydrolase [Candidatus Sumerlaeota bacterium]